MSAEENIALVRRFLEARAEGDLDAMDEIMAPDFVEHTLAPGQHSDREGVKRAVAQFSAAFSDVRFVIEELRAQGDKVVSRVSGRGTYDRSELMGVAPTGTEVASMAIFIHRIEGGKIVEEWAAGTGLSEVLRQRLEQERIERERIKQELQVARRIQQASLPEEVPTLEGWQISPFYQPAREVEVTSTTSSTSKRGGWA
jgi:predicted ester cyclase